MTAESLLRYLGGNAITDTCYFGEPGRTHVGEHASILISPRMLRPLLYALFITLHRYRSQPIVKRYDTLFRLLTDSLREDQEQLDAKAQANPEG